MTPKETGEEMAHALALWAVQQLHLQRAASDWRPVHVQLGRGHAVIFQPLGESVVFQAR
jgi:hypothetical protein